MELYMSGIDQKSEMLQAALAQSENKNKQLAQQVTKLEGQLSLYSANLVALQGQRDSLTKTDLEVRVSLEQEKAIHTSNVDEAKSIIKKHEADLEEVRGKFGQVQHKYKVAEQSLAKLSDEYTKLKAAIQNLLIDRKIDLTVGKLLDVYSPDSFRGFEEEPADEAEPTPIVQISTAKEFKPAELQSDDVEDEAEELPPLNPTNADTRDIKLNSLRKQTELKKERQVNKKNNIS